MRKINIIILLIASLTLITWLCVVSTMCVIAGNEPVNNYPKTRDFCDISLITSIISYLIGGFVYCIRKFFNKENRQFIKDFWNE